jgi:hypothetical protein
MKPIHTFWSRAYQHGRWGKPSRMEEEVWCFALSLHFAKERFGEIHLITDTDGLDTLGELPYTTISSYLDVLHDENPVYWTLGKITGMSHVDGAVLHIDGDVFLLDERVNAIMQSEWDIVVQHKEKGNHWTSTYPPILKFLRSKGIPVGPFETGFSYNHGIIGFRDPRILRDYTNSYTATLEEFKRAFHTFPSNRDPNIIVEQSLLASRVKTRDLKVREFLPEEDVDVYGVERAAEMRGYVHLWGESKYEPRWQEMVRRRMEVENPELYGVAKKIIKNISK